MSRLKLLPYRDLAKVAEAAGFKWARCQGSHNTFRSTDGRIIVIPDHGKQVIVRHLLQDHSRHGVDHRRVQQTGRSAVKLCWTAMDRVPLVARAHTIVRKV
ncbi:MAG: type II toxin-antitoxin system HicA family toxin [Anaerolineae bacterium]|nr:type II toxin-antitoxin system HicA family toxin [Anaerolineae bacterium]